MILADKIIALRKQHGWSQEELAGQLGVSRQAVSKWESTASIPDLVWRGSGFPNPDRQSLCDRTAAPAGDRDGGSPARRERNFYPKTVTLWTYRTQNPLEKLVDMRFHIRKLFKDFFFKTALVSLGACE